ncbi:MAG: hypothetical protein IPJ81_13490 [Chitinophagaceae bacterium]|nr:hypothetical protein [Chitinophagaceae bacterium]
MKQLITYCFITLIALSSSAQTEEHLGEDKYNYVKKDMLILFSTKSFKDAQKFAKQASKNLLIKTDPDLVDSITPNEEEGLTFTRTHCQDSHFEYPCYVARGRGDDGEYISIEYSTWINGFKDGYYIVIAASGDKEITQPSLKKIKKVYKDAYVKQTEVYMGCIH